MNRACLNDRLRELTTHSHTASPVGSCYLDTGAGVNACRNWLSAQLEKTYPMPQHAGSRQSLLPRLERAIAQCWRPGARSLALFWDTENEHALPAAIPLQAEIDNRFSLHSRPDIRPLAPLINPETNVRILSYLKGQLQIFEVSLGKLQSVALGLVSLSAASDRPQQNTPRQINAVKRLNRLRQLLVGSKTKPLVLAARDQDMARLQQWIPRAVAWKSGSHITLPRTLEIKNLPHYLERQFTRQRQLAANAHASRLLDYLRVQGPAVAGKLTSLLAIKQQKAAQLLVTQQALDEPVGRCVQCGTAHQHINRPGACSSCGNHVSSSSQHVIDACWVAVEQGLPVSRVESNQLQILGGMGCLLNHKSQPQAVTVEQRLLTRHLDMVA